VGPGAGDKLCDELPCLVLQVQVMGQHSRGLGRVDGAEPARAKVCDEAVDRRIGANEQPPASPRDDVDVRIALHKPWRWRGGSPRAERR